MKKVELDTNLINEMSKREFEKYKSMFHRFNSSGSGEITKEELETIMRHAGMNPTKE